MNAQIILTLIIIILLAITLYYSRKKKEGFLTSLNDPPKDLKLLTNQTTTPSSEQEGTKENLHDPDLHDNIFNYIYEPPLTENLPDLNLKDYHTGPTENYDLDLYSLHDFTENLYDPNLDLTNLPQYTGRLPTKDLTENLYDPNLKDLSQYTTGPTPTKDLTENYNHPPISLLTSPQSPIEPFKIVKPEHVTDIPQYHSGYNGTLVPEYPYFYPYYNWQGRPHGPYGNDGNGYGVGGGWSRWGRQGGGCP